MIVTKRSAKWISVITTRTFDNKAAKIMTEQDRDEIVDMLARDPECGVVLDGGLRKVRVALQGRGKRGGARVIYCYHSDDIPVLAITVFGKNEQDNLSKKELGQLVAAVKQYAKEWRAHHG
jgi:hypothetical protein